MDQETSNNTQLRATVPEFQMKCQTCGFGFSLWFSDLQHPPLRVRCPDCKSEFAVNGEAIVSVSVFSPFSDGPEGTENQQPNKKGTDD
jgi:ribosomal protein S27E